MFSSQLKVAPEKGNLGGRILLPMLLLCCQLWKCLVTSIKADNLTFNGNHTFGLISRKGNDKKILIKVGLVDFLSFYVFVFDFL